MTQTTDRLKDEFAKLVNDAAGVAQGVRREAETAFRTQAERILGGMDLVQREEFEAVRDMAKKARDENEALRAEIEQMRDLIAKKAPTRRKKPTAAGTKKPQSAAKGTS